MGDPRKRLTRRERQIVEVIYRLEEATVGQVRAEIPDAPGYDSVRTTMRILEEKGVLRHHRLGQRYVYSPVVDKARARHGVLRDLVRTFFDGSAEAAALALLKLESGEAAHEDLEQVRAQLDDAQKQEEDR